MRRLLEPATGAPTEPANFQPTDSLRKSAPPVHPWRGASVVASVARSGSERQLMIKLAQGLSERRARERRWRRNRVVK
jgi:hypothetical protein